MKIYLISACTKIHRHSSTSVIRVGFHYRGHFLGKEIAEVECIAENMKLELGREYLLDLEVECVQKRKLLCRLGKAWPIDELSI